MPESRGLHVAITLAERKRDACSRQLMSCQQNVHSADRQMAQLQSYVGETDGRLIARGSAGLPVELLKHHYQFSGRLHQAIELQQGVIANLQRQVEGAKRQLLQAEMRLTGLKTLLKKRLAEADLLARKHEQAQIDEMAAQLFARARAELTNGDAR